MANIVVVGSLNMDLVVQVPAIPKPGETVLGDNFATFPGGKGANQAVAAVRLGAKVSLIGCIGADSFGGQLLDIAGTEGVDITGVSIDPDTATGVAMISVDKSGQNSIAVASGANFRLTSVHVREAWERIDHHIDTLVMPLETPLETIITAAELAKKSGARVVLNPAPARSLPGKLLKLVDVLVPNEPETAQLTDMSVGNVHEIRQATRSLLNLGVKSVVLTLGARGTMVLAGNEGTPSEFHLEAHQVNVVDTTAAGDAFVAALAVALGENKPLEEAAAFANATGALTVTKPGAQPSLPFRDEVEQLLHSSRQSE
jgi:ribokinase